MDITKPWLIDFLVSLDGFDALVALCLVKGMTWQEIASLMACSRWKIQAGKARLQEEYLAFEKEVLSGEKEEEAGEVSEIFAEAGEGFPLCSIDGL